MNQFLSWWQMSLWGVTRRFPFKPPARNWGIKGKEILFSLIIIFPPPGGTGGERRKKQLCWFSALDITQQSASNAEAPWAVVSGHRRFYTVEHKTASAMTVRQKRDGKKQEQPRVWRANDQEVLYISSVSGGLSQTSSLHPQRRRATSETWSKKEEVGTSATRALSVISCSARPAGFYTFFF